MYLLADNHYSLLVPTSDLRMGYDQLAYREPCMMEQVGHFVLVEAGESQTGGLHLVHLACTSDAEEGFW